MSENTYDLVINGYDWGPGIDKMILHNDKEISSTDLKIEDFAIEIETKGVNLESKPPTIINKKGRRTLTRVYLCDEKGIETEGKSKNISIEMSVHPDDSFSNPFLHAPDHMNYWQDPYKVIIINRKLKIEIKTFGKKICPLADLFKLGSSQTNDITLHYAIWEPKTSAEKIPMIIWLHGMAEGGNDPYLVLLGNKVVNLITPEVQNSFGSTGAYVLAPQANGFWMQTKCCGIDKGFEEWISEKSELTVSYYTKALFNLIEEVIKQNPKVDKNRIYIGGCSNGGYMTLNMLLEYPDYFAAAFPICQAYPNSRIDDKKIEVLAKEHIWFTVSKDDQTVNPDLFTLPIFKRLKDAGANDVHLSLWEHVVDQTGLYFNREKKPYTYIGHFSWVYVLNNQCKENGVRIFDWISKQSKK